VTVVLVVVALLVGLAVGAALAFRRATNAVVSMVTEQAEQTEQTEHRPTGFLDAVKSVETARRSDVARNEQLTDTVRRAERALDALPYGIGIWMDGQQITANRVFRELTGADRHGVTIRRVVDSTVTAVRPGRPIVEERYDFDEHPRQVILVSANRLYDGTVTCTVEDITRRAYLEDVRRDFVANISHELRTPVGAVALLAETIADEPDPEVARRLAARMTSEAYRLDRIVSDLLELSLLEGGTRPATAAVATDDLFADVLARTGPLAEARSVTVASRAEVGELQIDRRQIASALANLVDNAVRYSPNGAIVEMAAERRADSVVLSVTDHGLGIPRHELNRIFERFYRVDKARHHETGGTGLGLAIVRHVATNHDGEVRVTSEEGVGSRFEIELPQPEEAAR
jgi:two-component system, OmpR family, sensor histidine kinase SenX3